MNCIDVAPLSDWGFFTLPRPSTIAGPCSAESEEQIMDTARRLKAFGINVFRAGIWKPRTHPGSFEGVGIEGLPWLVRVQRELGMKVGTEVASEKHVRACLEYGLDMVWLGARTTANPFLVQEIAEALHGTDIPVLVKNPVNPDIDLWIGAIERLQRQGIRKIGVIHRGFSTFDKIKYRNAPQWQVLIELKTRFPQMPFFCDPSHMAGDRAYLKEISQRAMDLGLDGLMVESHCNPSCALSDARQQLVPEDLKDLLESLIIREKDIDNPDYHRSITELRERIDVLDENLLGILSKRMSVSGEIGKIKRDNNISIIQAARWDEIMENVLRLSAESGLDDGFIRNIFSEIHEASIAVQNKILSQK